jgi:hypothetical protein
VRDHLTTPRAYRRKRGGPEAGDKYVGDFRLFLPLLRRDRAARIHLVPGGARLSGDRSFALASHIGRDHGKNPAAGARLPAPAYSLLTPRVLRRILKTSKIFLKRNVGCQWQVGYPSNDHRYDFGCPPSPRLQTDSENFFSGLRSHQKGMTNCLFGPCFILPARQRCVPPWMIAQRRSTASESRHRNRSALFRRALTFRAALPPKICEPSSRTILSSFGPA